MRTLFVAVASVTAVLMPASPPAALAAPGVVIIESRGSTDVAERGATDTYDIVLTSKPKDDVTVAVGGSGDQVTVKPSSIEFEDDEWDEPQTVRVRAVDDAVVEGPHTATLTHTATSDDPTYDGIGIADVTVAISDNDAIVRFAQATTDQIEGDAGTTDTVVELELETAGGKLARRTTVEVVRTGGTASPSGDAADFAFEAPAKVTFPAGSGDGTTRSVTVAVNGDTFEEPDETLILGLRKPTGGAVIGAPERHTLTILDDEGNVPPAIDKLLITDAGGAPKTTFKRGETVKVYVEFSDPDVTDTHDVRVSWNDGTPDFSEVVPATGEVNRTIAATHEYTDAAPQTITVIIDDGEGGTVTMDAVTIFVAPGLGAQLETVGLVDPAGFWSLRNSAGDVTSFFYGNPGDIPVIGDWDCDGDETPGMYRQSDGFVYLRNSNTQGIADVRFFFGDPGDVPIVGDFNGDGCHTVSVYRPSQSRVFIINELGENGGGLGAAEVEYVFGNPGDRPFVGDFDGDGIETIGLHRASTGLVYFRNTHTQGSADNEFIFGDAGDRLAAGDWVQTGIDSPVVFRPGNTTFFFRHSNTQGVADNQFSWGNAADIPVAGFFGLDG